ncbi:MAG: HAD-IB family hydrolase [Bacteroidota bacterium]
METNPPSIAFFDFDGTITNNDSFLQFLLITHGRFGFFLRLLLLTPIFLLYKLKLISDHNSKVFIFSSFYKNKSFEEVSALANQFSLSKLPTYVKHEAMERIQWHIAQQHKVVVVSAGFSFILKPWCDAHQLHLIATEIEVVNGKITGRFASANCWGKGKVQRINEEYLLSDYYTIFAYGDSEGDKELLSIAHKAFYKTFH